MKFTIAILAAIPMLVMAAILVRACSPPAAEPMQRSQPIAAPTDSKSVDRMHDRHEGFDMTSRSAEPTEPAISLLEPTEAEPSANMESSNSTLNPPASALPSDEAETAAKSVDLQLSPGERLTLDQTGTTDTSLRNADYPRTYISAIRVDLASPNHWVRLTWAGPEAASQETGPFHSSPGRGLGNNDCDDFAESNRTDSNCTPKGKMQVQGFSDNMPSYAHCTFVTWFLASRGIAFHYYPSVPNYPASHGCVRLDEHAAQLIHNNAKFGATEVTVDGTWTFGR